MNLENSKAWKDACAAFEVMAKRAAERERRHAAMKKKPLRSSSTTNGSHIFGGERPYRPIRIGGSVG